MFTIRCENIVRAATRKTAPEYPNMRTGASRFPRNLSETESGEHSRKLRPDMIHRVDGTPKLVNPSGSIIEGLADPANVLSPDPPDSLETSFPSGPHARQPPPVQESSRTPSPISSTSSEFRVGQSTRRYS